MPVTYFHRYRMQYDLRDGLFEPQPTPPGYQLVPWQDDLLDHHSDVKFESFHNELDASVFPCLGDREGCRRLMKEICSRQGFLPQSTWLIRFDPNAIESAIETANETATGDGDGGPVDSRNNAHHQQAQLGALRAKKNSAQQNCGTVQGIRAQTDVGSIQNIGIANAHRGKGLGSLLVYHCLKGFHEAGVRFVTLEVTSHNTGAFRLYQRLGFRVLKTVFKSVEINY